jgi:hypothetical protein
MFLFYLGINIHSMLSALIYTLCLLSYITEQGHHNDLKNKNSDDHRLTSPGVSNSSDSIHCNRLTQSTVSSGWSFHTTASCTDKEKDMESSTHLKSVSNPHSWVHVFSRSTASTSLHTQCTTEAYRNVKSTKVLHRRSCCAKKKERKLTSILHEMAVPPETFKLSHQQIDSEVIVFDGGNSTIPHVLPLNRQRGCSGDLFPSICYT